MLRNVLSVLLAVAVGAFSTEPVAYAQYGAPPGTQYSAQQYPPQYRQGAGYPQGPSPQAGQYPGPGQYPQAPGYPQDSNPPDAAGDQQHGVARISIVQGDVNVRRGDAGELVAAIMNAPLMAQDRLETSPGSRAEVELDYGNLIRLAPNTDLGFADLEYRRHQLQLGAGTIIFRVLRDSSAQTEIDTPSIAIRPVTQGAEANQGGNQGGEYRISVLDDGTTQITVRSGQVQIYSPHGAQVVGAGRSILVRGNPSDPEFQQTYELARDQFDDWSAGRDHDLLASQSYKYVSNDVYGVDDLDAYGNWVPSQYGQVWEPRPPVADWSPYSYGQWAWEGYYGWTWVDYAPWGWAPYHYGRWFWNGGRGWCWWPGAIGSRFLWSPALVGFFGWGGIGLGVGGLGWVALAPFESFHSWWGHGFGFGGYGRRDFAFGRGSNLAGMYRNAAIRGGAMTAGYNNFGGPNHRFDPATRGELMNANLIRGQLPISPTRASYRFSNRPAMANPRLASAANRQFFQHQQPRYQAGVNGSGFAGSRFATPRQNVRGVAPNTGWQRFGDPSNAYRQNFTGGQEPSGWHRFGAPQSNYRGSYSPGAYGGSYAPRQNYSGAYSGAFGGAHQSYSAPRYNAPSAPHYNAPSAGYRGGGGGSPGRGGGSPHGGGGHSSSGGHHGR